MNKPVASPITAALTLLILAASWSVAAQQSKSGVTFSDPAVEKASVAPVKKKAIRAPRKPPPRRAVAGSVTFSFKGKKTSGILITEHTASGSKTTKPRIAPLNQTATGVALTSRKRREVEVTEGAAGKEGATAKAEGKPIVIPKNEEGEIDKKAALELLRQNSWVVYAEGDEIPDQVYNPFTKQFVNTDEAIKQLEDASKLQVQVPRLPGSKAPKPAATSGIPRIKPPEPPKAAEPEAPPPEEAPASDTASGAAETEQ